MIALYRSTISKSVRTDQAGCSFGWFLEFKKPFHPKRRLSLPKSIPIEFLPVILFKVPYFVKETFLLLKAYIENDRNNAGVFVKSVIFVFSTDKVSPN